MKETYYSGKYILNYADFLPHQDRIELYYKLGVHAYNLRFYNESIEHCKKIFTDENGTYPYRAYALGVLRDSFFALEKYEESELYSLQYKQFNYPNAQENVVLMEALFKAVKGNTGQAIKELHSFLETCSDAFVLSASRHLIRLYLDQSRIEDVKAVLESGRINSSIVDKRNPLTYYGYGEYLRLQAKYYLAIGEIEKCIDSLMDGALCFSKINDTITEKGCLNMVIHIHIEHNTSMNRDILEKLSNYYIMSTKETEG
ncbi:transcriptional regulator [Paenibacillus profundus]|uniref:Transcriptional regulator n=1 Tax=Paenibacillus profundus TaxID=1173085 RepID=A0ABS8YQE3_9BACL|nr:transcriptional regulator [Paenibacillus profundus]MCE5172560.1 transcriptional regulator [Paenibacillus profundus]